MADGWDRLVAAVGEAASMDPATANAYLRDTFADDASLLHEAEAILDGGLDPDEFLSNGDDKERPATGLVEGAEFGGYRVRRVLGRGGMGAVFLADQAVPKRAVALKIIEGSMLSDRARARFEYEMQALATLHHRGIAQIYEIGVERLDDGLMCRDVPWFAMEYVEGASTLLSYADAHQLSTEDRLRLMLEVCEAVHHGHQKGVVHRDLKPDNILVNSAGHPKVIDFGVARGIDTEDALTQHTGPAEIVGTLPYLSPERVTTGRGEADVRTDVYALGVVLYQLLTGRLPIEVDAADIVTSARRICEESPLRPSSTNTSLPPDLDAIVLKALAKDPAERYASVDAAAEDLHRFLEHRPVNARAPGAWYHFRLFTRRHRALVVSAVAVLAIVVVATLVSVNWALRAEESEQRATEEKAQAVEQRGRAEQLFETVFKRGFEATLREAPKLHKMAGGTERVNAMMSAVLEDLRVLEAMAEGDPRVQVLLAETWIKLGDTQGNKMYANLDDPEAAQSSYRHALEICNTVDAQHPAHRGARLASVRSRIRLGEILDQAEKALRMRGKREPALREERRTVLERALVDARALHEETPDDRSCTEQLVNAHAQLGRLALDERNFAVVREHAQALDDLHAAGRLDSPIDGQLLRAWSYQAEQKWDAASTAWAAVVATNTTEVEESDASHGARLALATNLGSHGESVFLAGHRHEAVESLEHAVRIFEKLAEEAPKDRRVSIQLQIQLGELARVYGALAHEDGAENRETWLQKSRVTLTRAIHHLGPPESDNRHRARMRRALQAKVDKLGSAKK